MSKSTKLKSVRKPKLPIRIHAGSNQWCKVIAGRIRYFGSARTDPEGVEALKLYSEQREYWERGETPPARRPLDVSNGLTMKALVNHFLTAKRHELDAGDIGSRSWRDYFYVADRLVEHFGVSRIVSDLRPDDFQGLRRKIVARHESKVSVKNEINRVRTIFNHAFRNDLIDRPVRYGTMFEAPPAAKIQEQQNAGDVKLFARDEVLKLLESADPQVKAMTLLGLSCGLGNHDIANLRECHIKGEWLDFPRVKNATPRRMWLWPEAREAVQAAIAVRPSPADSELADRIFLTRLGKPWVRVQEYGWLPTVREHVERDGGADKWSCACDECKAARKAKYKGAGEPPGLPIDALSQAFRKLLRKLGINGHRNFYCLRHCFETYAGECKDQVAVDFIMGHRDQTMARNYRHGISDERLKAATETVRAWLWPPSATSK